MGERFDPDLLDDQEPFEIDSQAAHLFKHPHLGVEDIEDVWASGPLFSQAAGALAHVRRGRRPGTSGTTRARPQR